MKMTFAMHSKTKCMGKLAHMHPGKYASNRLKLGKAFLYSAAIYMHYRQLACTKSVVNYTCADAGSAHPPSGRKCPFCRRVHFSIFVPMLLETPKKALVHCTKPKISPEKALVHCTKPKRYLQKKNYFFTTRIVESYSQMPGNAY
jgi:hypothetical protein